MLDYLVFFIAGAFAANAIPHVVNGISGRAFTTPFAKPPGRGQSSSVANVVWGTANIVAAGALIYQVGPDALSLRTAAAGGVGAFVMALLLAWHFGRLYGGDQAR